MATAPAIPAATTDDLGLFLILAAVAVAGVGLSVRFRGQSGRSRAVTADRLRPQTFRSAVRVVTPQATRGKYISSMFILNHSEVSGGSAFATICRGKCYIPKGFFLVAISSLTSSSSATTLASVVR